MKIKSIRVRAVAAPMKRPLATSTGALTVAPLLLVDLRTDGGIVGRSYLFGIGPNALKPDRGARRGDGGDGAGR